MTGFNLNKIRREADTAETLAAKQASKRRPGRMVRKLASSPVSFYNWLSGPPLTELDRSRANLAYAEGAQGWGALIV